MKRSSSAASGAGEPLRAKAVLDAADDRRARVEQHAVEVEQDRPKRHARRSRTRSRHHQRRQAAPLVEPRRRRRRGAHRSTHSSSGSSPEIRPQRGDDRGLDAGALERPASSGTRSSASTAWPMRSGISAAGRPRASSSPARRLRHCGASAVPTRSPVRRGRSSTPAARPGARRSARPRGRRARRPRRGVEAWDSVRPRPARRRSWPRRRARRRSGRRALGDDAGALETSAIVSVSRASSLAATSPAPSVTISRACAGPPTQATRRRRALGEQHGRRDPAGGTSPLASEIDRRAGAQPARRQPGDHLFQAARGDAEEHEVRAAGRRDRLDAQLAWQLDAGQVLAVLALLEPLACSAVRVCSVVRKPPRASSTATAVPNEPAPITTARREPGGQEVAAGASG